MKLREWFCTVLASMIGMSQTYLWTNIETRVNQYRNKVELYNPKTNIKLVTECHYYVIVIMHLRSKQLPSQKNKNKKIKIQATCQTMAAP